MQDLNALVDRLRVLFRERFQIDVPTPDTDLLDSGIVDSLQFVDLLVRLEQEFGAHLDIETIELDDLRTLARLASLLAAQGKAATPTALHPASSDAPMSAKIRKLSIAG